MRKTRQVTLEFRTKEERDLWIKWYRGSGSTHFFGVLAQYPYDKSNTKTYRKWRKVAEDRMNNWPHYNERFVE